MSSEKNDEFVEYPEINSDYRHYKGGRYTVITLAKHSEHDRMEHIIERLEKQKMSAEGTVLLAELKKIVLDTQVVYKSVGFGSVHIRPLFMWFQKIKQSDVLKRFTKI